MGSPDSSPEDDVISREEPTLKPPASVSAAAPESPKPSKQSGPLIETGQVELQHLNSDPGAAAEEESDSAPDSHSDVLSRRFVK